MLLLMDYNKSPLVTFNGVYLGQKLSLFKQTNILYQPLGVSHILYSSKLFGYQ
jgi:hypothetical protein